MGARQTVFDGNRTGGTRVDPNGNPAPIAPAMAGIHGGWTCIVGRAPHRKLASRQNQTGDVGMSELQFLERARELGYGDCQFKSYPANMDGPLHTHDFAVILLVVSGEFALATENGSTAHLPGECCELAAGVVHAERTGADGAKVLLGKRYPTAAPGR
jgi:hypothetical protein